VLPKRDKKPMAKAMARKQTETQAKTRIFGRIDSSHNFGFDIFPGRYFLLS